MAALPLLGLTVLTTTTNQAFACGLDNVADCFSAGASSGGYYAGQQDAIYDHDHSNQYNPVGQCYGCHTPDYWNNFRQGYDTEWNSYQSQLSNVYINNSPGVRVNVGQTADQNQGPSVHNDQPVGCGGGPCGGGLCNVLCGPCSGSCNGPAVGGPCSYGCDGVPGPYGYHHFWHWHEGGGLCGFGGCGGGFGYRHVFTGEDPGSAHQRSPLPAKRSFTTHLFFAPQDVLRYNRKKDYDPLSQPRMRNDDFC